VVDGIMDDAHAQQLSHLMTAAQSGDKGAYAQLLREVLPFIRATCMQRWDDPMQVEANVRKVLQAVHRLRHTYNPARSFARWLAAISDYCVRHA
jgi:RNA polymerase sigma-70 factor (ECF subfamily)